MIASKIMAQRTLASLTRTITRVQYVLSNEDSYTPYQTFQCACVWLRNSMSILASGYRARQPISVPAGRRQPVALAVVDKVLWYAEVLLARLDRILVCLVR